MSVIHAPKRPDLDLRSLVFPICIGLGIGAIFLRLWYVQVVMAPDLQDLAERSRNTVVEKPAPRGMMIDRNGKVVAGVRSQFVVTAIPKRVKKNSEALKQLAEVLKMPEKKLEDKLFADRRHPELPRPLAVGVSVEVATKIAESIDSLDGISVESQPMRYYPDALSLSHVLGYVWTPSDRDVKRFKELGLEPPAYVGKSGVEYVYERELMGEPGADRFEVDSKKVRVNLVERDNPIPGSQLQLTIDGDLQKYALEALQGRVGAVAVLEPQTGEVLALVSSPTYDSSLWENGISSQDWLKLSTDPEKPLINRATYSSYAPGSTFKIVTALAAVRSGELDMRRTFYCRGYYQTGKRKSKCLGVHGSISFHEAFVHSCNTYFTELGVRAGRKALEQAALDVGLNAKTGIDSTPERRGLIPTDKWLAKRHRTWYQGDQVNMSIGQGDVAATPLQMANIASLVANDGKQYRPHLVSSIRTPDGVKKSVQPEVLHSVEAPSWFWKELKSAMADVVANGTARTAQIEGLRWGGKTGSAEKRGQDRTDSWFVGVAPIDKPQVAICVLVENAGHGGDIAAPIAADVVHHYLFTEKKLTEKKLAQQAPPAGAPRTN